MAMLKWQVGHNQASWGRALQPWQRLLVGGYALLFAAVFPFVCWGGLAGASHPHLFPHLVFLDPAEPLQPLAGQAPNHSHITAPHQHDHSHLTRYEPTAGEHTPVVPTGRATLTLLIFSLFLLIFYAQSVSTPADRSQVLLRYALPFPASTALPVPHPPPRLTSLG